MRTTDPKFLKSEKWLHDICDAGIIRSYAESLEKRLYERVHYFAMHGELDPEMEDFIHELSTRLRAKAIAFHQKEWKRGSVKRKRGGSE